MADEREHEQHKQIVKGHSQYNVQHGSEGEFRDDILNSLLFMSVTRLNGSSEFAIENVVEV